jgi:membrane protease YdiL (CAAX protease family)
VAILAALAGGVWRVVPAEGLSLGSHVSALVLLAAGAEFLFRGVAHGVLGRGFQVAHAGGRWLISFPTAVCALMYTGAGLLLPLAGSPFPMGGATAQWLTVVAASLLFGLTVGVVRERSGSILAPVLLHLVGVALLELLA